ncbi:hypothetical protein DMUE_5499 [Dictyocoela muelleri]|nr:hypothetical protein DMUE_5499 [Dictyocoela muelleri]
MTKEQLRLSEFLGYARELLQDKVNNYICRGCLGRVKWNDKEKNEVRCGRRGCRKRRPLINKKPFFNTLLSISDIFKVIFHLAIGDKAANISLVYGIDKNSVRRILLDMQDVLTDYNRNIRLGGLGVVVEIDESKFGNRKYNRGHRVSGSWIVGGVERSARRYIFLQKYYIY